MSTLVTYKEIDGGSIQEVSPDPTAAGGLALNTNFRALADSLPRNNYGASTNPTPDNDSVDTAGIGVDFAQGSRWYNGTAIFECVDPTPTAAVWVPVSTAASTPTLEQVTTAGATTDVASTFSAGISCAGSTLNMNDGSGSGGGTLNIDGGTLNLSNGSGSGGGSLNLDGAFLQFKASEEGTYLFEDSPFFLHIVANGVVFDGALVNINNEGSLRMNGGNVVMNDGSGFGGGNLNLDGASINFGTGASLTDNGNAGIKVSSTMQVTGSSTPLTGSGMELIYYTGVPCGFVYTWNRDTGTGMQTWLGGNGSLRIRDDVDGRVESGATINMLGNSLNFGSGSGSGGGTLSLDNGVITNAQLLQFAPQSSAPTPIAGGFYFDGTHFYVCKDGSTWNLLS